MYTRLKSFISLSGLKTLTFLILRSAANKSHVITGGVYLSWRHLPASHFNDMSWHGNIRSVRLHCKRIRFIWMRPETDERISEFLGFFTGSYLFHTRGKNRNWVTSNMQCKCGHSYNQTFLISNTQSFMSVLWIGIKSSEYYLKYNVKAFPNKHKKNVLVTNFWNLIS